MSAAVAVAALVWMGLRYAASVEDSSAWLEACQVDPGACAARRVALALVEVQQIHPDGYTVLKVTTPVRLVADPTGLSPGQTISVEAEFTASGLRVLRMETHPYREAKKILGLVGLGLAGLAAGLGWRWDRGLVERG